MVRSLDADHDLTAADLGGVAAMGNFDGVHRGHTQVVATARTMAERLSVPLVAVVFKPHPRRYFRPDTPPFRLMSDDQRAEALGELGVERVHHLAFGPRLAAMSPDDFAKDIIKDQLRLDGVVTGRDFHFGKDRAGTPETLKALGAKLGFESAIAEEIAQGEDKISSTGIRQALQAGDPATAERLLGRLHAIAGVVFRGDQRGRQLGFPTANIDLDEYLRPHFGVYAVRVHIPGESVSRPGVANIGRRPTVDGNREQLEVHILDFNDDLYGRVLGVDLVDFIRPEQKFDGLEALKAQIAIDSEKARQILNA